MAVKIRLEGDRIVLPLNRSQGGIRIADEHGNHVPKPTRTRNDEKYLIEWMITNDEIDLLHKTFLRDAGGLVQRMKDIKGFAEDSEYSKRKTRSDREEIARFEGFKIYHYSEDFNSFEKGLGSGIRVRITFKLGAYGLEVHPHMYVLVPFDYGSLRLMNHEGEVQRGSELGSGCRAELALGKEDIEEIILTLSHASSNHRNALVDIIES